MNQKQAKEALKNHGYTYNDALSSNQSKVFTDATGTPHIAFRGTKNIWDVGTDALLGLGLEKYSKRFQDSKKLTNLVEQTYNKPVNVFGHSLGGSLAEKSGAKGSITTYNKGTGIGDIGRTIPARQIDIRTTDDIVSALAPTQKYRGKYVEIPTYGQDLLTAHNLDNIKYYSNE